MFHLFHRRKLMTDIADNVAATLTAVQALTAQVSALSTAVAAIEHRSRRNRSTDGRSHQRQCEARHASRGPRADPSTCRAHHTG